MWRLSPTNRKIHHITIYYTFSSHQLLVIAPGKPRFDWHKNWNTHHCIDHWSFQQGECRSMLWFSKLHGVFKGLYPKQQHRIAKSMAVTSAKWSVFIFHLYCNHLGTPHQTCPDTTAPGRHHPFWWCSNDNYTFLWLSRICVCRTRLLKHANTRCNNLGIDTIDEENIFHT